MEVEKKDGMGKAGETMDGLGRICRSFPEKVARTFLQVEDHIDDDAGQIYLPNRYYSCPPPVCGQSRQVGPEIIHKKSY